jgi:hypothetical protein
MFRGGPSDYPTLQRTRRVKARLVYADVAQFIFLLVGGFVFMYLAISKHGGYPSANQIYFRKQFRFSPTIIRLRVSNARMPRLGSGY